MSEARTSEGMSPELLKVADRAKRNPQERLLALARLIDVPALSRAFSRIRRNASVGVDGVTVDEYLQSQEENIRNLHGRMKAGKYRHQPIRRVNIPKENGKTRPIGVSTVEDKVVQGAIREVLEAVYEQEFLECSYGFRPKRRAHEAMQAIDWQITRGGARYILEADIVSFFDSLDRTKLMEMLRERVADESMMRLVGKCLRAGVLDGEEYSEPERGTAQGSALSPMLGNIYLHNVLDVWFERIIKPSLTGRSALVRYADDFVICFESKQDAVRVGKALRERMAEYGLMLHPEKTRLLAFRPPPNGGAKGNTSFDFLGFTVHWHRTRTGRWRVAYKTRRARLQRAIKALAEWCQRQRHLSVKQQHATLTRKLKGHYGYFGVNGNIRSLKQLKHRAEDIWQKWLERRSQRARNWKWFKAILKCFPLPEPRIVVKIWSGP